MTIRQKVPGKYADDPRVPLSADRLAGAIAFHGHSLGTVARAAGTSKQGLHHLAERGRSCRGSLRRALARVLRVPEAFLAGEAKYNLGALAYLIVADDARTFRERGLEEAPTRAHAPRWNEITVGGWAQSIYAPGTWRALLLDGARPPTLDEQDEAARAASAFLRVVLAPWLRGQAQLRRDGLSRIAAVLRRVGGRPTLADLEGEAEFVREERARVRGQLRRARERVRVLRSSSKVPERYLRDAEQGVVELEKYLKGLAAPRVSTKRPAGAPTPHGRKR